MKSYSNNLFLALYFLLNFSGFTDTWDQKSDYKMRTFGLEKDFWKSLLDSNIWTVKGSNVKDTKEREHTKEQNLHDNLLAMLFCPSTSVN